MLTVDYSRWGQDPDIVRVLGLNAEHPRTRERFLALYEIGGDKNASQIGRETDRNPQPVMEWVPRYHTVGPAAWVYQPTGGRSSLFTPTLEPGVAAVIRDALQQAATPPQERTAPPAPRWPLKRLRVWLKEQYQCDSCRETIRQALKRLGLSWKKARQLLNKADPHQREALLEKLNPLLVAATRDKPVLVYLDEAHFRQDTAEGYGWSSQGERFWVSCSSPGLGATVSCYGVYFYHQGQVKLYPYDRATSETTLELLETLRRELPGVPLTVLWDGASYHRAQGVTQRAEALQINLLPLPADSPDFMPVEHRWQWLREEVTYHIGYNSREELMAQIEHFQQEINAIPYAVADRLWVKNHLDPEEEKLRVSK